jgi:hypothetical protein
MSQFPYVVAIGPTNQTVVTTRTNLCPNPSFETNIDSMSTSGTTITRVTSDSFSGVASLQAVATSNLFTNFASWVSNRASAIPGDVITASAYVRNTVGATRGHLIRIRAYNGSGTNIANFSGTPVVVDVADGWVRISHTVTMPVNTTSVGISVNYQTTNPAIGNTTLIDAILVEKTNTVGSYFDGNTPDTLTDNYEWSGIANNSQSTLVTTNVIPTTAPAQVLTSFDSWTLDRNLDDGCTLSFSLMGNSLSGVLIKELETDVWLYRDGVLEQRFRVLEVDQTWDADGRNTKQVVSVCYRRLLGSRHLQTNLSFVGVSQGDIVWDLIQHTQAQTNGNLGVSLVSAGPTVLRDREYQAGQNILEAIVDLSKAEDGIAWEIDENLGLIVTQPELYPSKPQPVQLGTNARNISKPSGAALFANTVIVSGDTQNTTLVIEEATGLASDARGRWERYNSYPSAQLQTTLVEQARGLLNDTISPAIVYKFDIETSRFLSDSNYELGDFTTIVEPSTVVPSFANPTVPSLVVDGERVAIQILTQSITVTADGDIRVTYNAVRSFQRWDDIADRFTWDSLDAGLTWDNLDNTYIT